MYTVRNITLLDFQRLFAPHAWVTLYSWPPDICSQTLWAGEIDQCDFIKFGPYNVIQAEYIFSLEPFGFRIYLELPGQ